MKTDDTTTKPLKFKAKINGAVKQIRWKEMDVETER